MLKTKAVSKHYQTKHGGVQALQELSIELEQGDFVAVTGPSGCGKSTLLLMLGGMLTPCSGEVLLDEVSVYQLSPAARAQLRQKKIGFVFQTFNLLPYLTALENVQVALMLAGASPQEQRTRALDLLERVELLDRQDHKPPELSVGQQQRVALARMMANQPQLILADEPTGNLDPETSGHIMALLCKLNQEEHRTIVMVTHTPEVARMAKRQLHLVQGALACAPS